MANTLNLGNGNWGVKKDSLLGYNSENNNYKPLPFDFTRASSATVVNKAGLIETVGSGEPRIDFSNDAKGALLLEPTRSNYQPYSEDFSVWNAADVTVSSSYGLSPDGSNNSSLITEGTGSAQHRILKASPASSGIYTFSCFVKNKVGNHQAYIDMGTVTGFFDFDTKTMYSAAGTTNIESWSNDWYRISITSNSNVTPSASYIGIGKNNTETFQGDGSSAIEFFGAQLEEGYATSYIPTSGSAVTRVGDVCNNGANEQVINSTEGVLYAEISALSDDLTLRQISLSDGTTSNQLVIYYGNVSNKIFYYLSVGGVAQVNDSVIISDIVSFNKIAFKYKQNDFQLWINGINVLSDLSGNTYPTSTLSELNLTNGQASGDYFYGNVKDVRVYNTALTDAELQQLTAI